MKTEQDLQQVKLQQIDVPLELIEVRLDQVVRRLDMLESELPNCAAVLRL